MPDPTSPVERTAYRELLDPLAEQTVLFAHIFKWVLLATITGILVGLGTAAFLKSMVWAIRLTGRYPYFYLGLPLAMFLSVLLIQYIAPEAEGHGVEKVIDAVHKRSGKMDAKVVPIKLLATVLTLAGGGSVGKEGPCAQIGAGMASFFADLLHFDDHDRKKIVICGIGAGFAAVFGTPISGAIFGVEVLFAGSIAYDVLLPSFVSGLISYQIAHGLGIKYYYHPVGFVPVFTDTTFLMLILAGIVFGLCAWMVIEMLRMGEVASKRLPIWPPLRGVVGGGILVLMTLVFSTKYLGLGLSSIDGMLQGAHAQWWDVPIKAIFTSLSLGFGGSGGDLTPLFFIGSAAGSVFAQVLHQDPATFAAIGLVAILAGAANTPIAASIMAVELFGPHLGPYAAISCVVSFLMTGHRSLYPTQILAVSKSQSLHVEIGREIEHAHAVPETGALELGPIPARLGRAVRDWVQRGGPRAPLP